MTNELDPDRLAELEREQGFLLRSLDDLDAELAAGDIEVDDHASLTDDYVRRLAEVTRSIDDRRRAFVDVDSGLSLRQRVLTTIAVIVVAVVAGVLLANASGFRTPGESLTGGIRATSTDLLAEAATLTREGLWPDAIEVYDQVLDQSPANAEALTYRAWIGSRLGEADDPIGDLDEAITIAPDYPDARVFRAILLDDAGRYDEAAADLAALDAFGVPAEMAGLIDGAGLRTSVALGQITDRFGATGTTVDVAEIEASLEVITDAGLLVVGEDAELGVRIFTGVLDADPDHVRALVAKGTLLGTTPAFLAEPSIAADGLALLDRAVELESTNDEYRLYRAFARNLQGDADGAGADLALIDRDALPPELAEVFDGLS